MRFHIGIGIVAAALVSLGASRAAHAQVYGPYTFDANSWVTAASATGYCYPYPTSTTDCAQNVIGHSPSVCAANIACAPGAYLEMFFGNTTIVNKPGVDLVVFDTRFSTDAASIAVETSPGVFTNYDTWAVNEQFPFAFGTGCDGQTLVAVPVDLSRFGLPLGFTTKRIRVGGNNATGSCEFDLTMAGVPIGSPICSNNTECNDGNPCTNDTCTNGSCSYASSGAPGCSACGDGVLAPGELCDDGNMNAGDGCSNCQIDQGFQCPTPGMPCTDIDECSLITAVCDTHATCENTPGSFICTCNPGYTGDGLSCVDIDECADGTDNCDPNATCANTPGSFTCNCNGGFTGDGVTCTDIDECAVDADNCDPNATCTNTPGSFTCMCKDGYPGDGTTCATLCGDGVVAGTEVCDDGNVKSGDGCSNACEIELGWTCGGSPSVCEAGKCGDGILAGVEGCDDGNTTNGDGCSATCTIQDGWTCSGGPSVCGAAACGDNIIAGTEACDDGNSQAGDGCSDSCKVEDGWTCEGAPSVCSNECEGAGPCGGEDPVDEGSCACSAPGSSSQGGAMGLWAGLLAVLFARHRRAQSKKSQGK